MKSTLSVNRIHDGRSRKQEGTIFPSATPILERAAARRFKNAPRYIGASYGTCPLGSQSLW